MKKLFQGDIAYISLTEEQFDKLLNGKPFDGKSINGKFVLAHGESGNHHTLTAKRKSDTVNLMDLGNGIFAIKIVGEAVVDHEKHAPAKTLKGGLWFASRQTEYNPIQERLVSD